MVLKTKYLPLLIFILAMHSIAMEPLFFDLVTGFEEENHKNGLYEEENPLVKKRARSDFQDIDENNSPLKKAKHKTAEVEEMVVEQNQISETQTEEEMQVELMQIRELQYELGIIHQRSRPKNIELTHAYFLKAANNGHPEAQHQVGKMYQYGNAAVQKNPQLAINWYSKAINQGNSRAGEKIKTVGSDDYLSNMPIEIIMFILENNEKLTPNHRLISRHFQNVITSNLPSLKGPSLIKIILYKDLKPFFDFINNLHKIKDLQLSIRKSDSGQIYRYKSGINSYLKYNKLDDYLLQNETLTSLSFSMDSLNTFGAKRIAQFLKGHKTLTSLNLHGNTINITEITEALKYNTMLTYLNMSLCNIHDKEAKNLWKALQKNTTLKSLNIADNYIGASKEKNQTDFAEMLRLNTTLNTLNLANNNISEGSVSSFTPALRDNTTLTYLDLSYNNIDKEGQALLHNIQGRSETLATLKLEDNILLFAHWDRQLG